MNYLASKIGQDTTTKLKDPNLTNLWPKKKKKKKKKYIFLMNWWPSGILGTLAGYPGFFRSFSLKNGINTRHAIHIVSSSYGVIRTGWVPCDCARGSAKSGPQNALATLRDFLLLLQRVIVGSEQELGCDEHVLGKSILRVPDTGTRVLAKTRPLLSSSIVSFWITPERSKGRKYHIFRQYWYTRNVPVFTNTGTFQYLGPEVYFFPVRIIF